MLKWKVLCKSKALQDEMFLNGPVFNLVSEPGAGLQALEEQSGDAEVVLQLLNVLVYLCCSEAPVHY